MSYTHVISAQADISIMHTKPISCDRSQNYMPPKAADALKKSKTANAASVSAAQ